MSDDKVLLLVLPIAILELCLKIAAFVSLSRAPAARGGKAMWVAIILLVGTIGPILWFVVGRDPGTEGRG